MAPTRHPLIDIVYNDETGRYIGMIERKLLMLTLENMRMRTLMGLLTGDMWDDYNFEAEDSELFDLAVDALMRRCQMSHEDARALVEDRWKATNPPEPDPALATYMVGNVRTSMPHVVSHARRIPESSVKFDHKKHIEGLEKSARNRERVSDAAD